MSLITDGSGATRSQSAEDRQPVSRHRDGEAVPDPYLSDSLTKGSRGSEPAVATLPEVVL